MTPATAQNHSGVLDLYTFSDLDRVLPGDAFEVTWAFRNDGAADWDEGLDKNNEGWFRKGIAQAYLNNPI